MKELISRLIDANASDVMRMREIVAAAEAEDRDLTAEEDANLATLDAKLNERNERRTRLEAAEAAAVASDEARSKIASLLVSAPERTTAPVETSTDTLVRLARAGHGEYEFRALADGTATNPTEFLARMAVYQRTLIPVLRVATILPSTEGNTLTLPRLTADLTNYTPGEGTAITESTPTVSSVSLTVTSWKGMSYLSNELVQDTPLAIENIVINSAGRSIAIAAGTEWTTGTTGFISTGTNGGTAAGTAVTGSTFFGIEDCIDLYHSLAAPYRMSPSAAWQVSTTALAKLRKAKSTTGGEFYFQPAGLANAQYDTFLGKPIFENPAMAAVGSASKSVAFGDWSAVFIKELPLRIEASRDYRMATDETTVKVVYRAGAAQPDAAAIKYLVSSAT